MLQSDTMASANKSISYIHLDTVDSTNSWAKKHVRPSNSLLCVTAEEQTGGRGQGSKSWVSPRGENLYASLCFAVPRDFPKINELNSMLARSPSSVLETYGYAAQIKQPNDLLINQKKVAGILTEAITYKDHIDLFLGIGINVNMTSEHLKQIDQPATSLQLESKDQQPLDRLKLLHALTQHFIIGVKL